MAKIIKKITLRDLYRNAGKIAREVERGVSFEVRVRNKRSFIIRPAESQTANEQVKNRKEILKQMAGFINTDPKHQDKTDDELIYD